MTTPGLSNTQAIIAQALADQGAAFPNTGAELVLAALKTALTITTEDALDELPTLSVVRDTWTSPDGWRHSGIWERRGYTWHCIAAPVLPPGHDKPNLPARVLWTPQ
jgi:hypothetical protein